MEGTGYLTSAIDAVPSEIRDPVKSCEIPFPRAQVTKLNDATTSGLSCCSGKSGIPFSEAKTKECSSRKPSGRWADASCCSNESTRQCTPPTHDTTTSPDSCCSLAKGKGTPEPPCCSIANQPLKSSRCSKPSCSSSCSSSSCSAVDDEGVPLNPLCLSLTGTQKTSCCPGESYEAKEEKRLCLDPRDHDKPKKPKISSSGKLPQKADKTIDMGTAFATLSVKGMDCAGCVVTLREHCFALPGIVSLEASAMTCIAEVYYDESLLSVQDIVDHVNLLQYTAKKLSDAITVAFRITPCKPENLPGIARYLSSSPGVSDVELSTSPNFPHTIMVSFYPDQTGSRTLRKAVIHEFGHKFDVTVKPYDISAVASEGDTQLNTLQTNFFFSLIFCIPMVFSAYIFPAISYFRDWNSFVVFRGLPVKYLVELLLATPVQFWLALPVYKSALDAAIYTHKANMDTLITISTNVAYFYSFSVMIAVLIYGNTNSHVILQEVFFETSVLVLTLILMGRYIEHMVKKKASTALSAVDEGKQLIRSLTREGEEITASLIERGDLLKIVPGAKIPADGIVMSGKSHVDEAILTGESRPVPKKKGNPIFAGTINQFSVFTMQVQKIPGETSLDAIAKQLQQTQLKKAAIERFTDTISGGFVSVVVLIAVGTFVLWMFLTEYGVVNIGGQATFPFALKFSLAVLVVSCPCALGLAAPTALLIGTTTASRLGILFKGGDSIEAITKADVFCFDKTGTLTAGTLQVTDVSFCPSPKVGVNSQRDMLRLVGSAELVSEHPIGRCILHYVSKDQRIEDLTPPLQSDIAVGEGVTCHFPDGVIVHVGNDRLMKKVSSDFTPTNTDRKWRKEGKTVVYVALGSTFLGSLAVADIIKEDAEIVTHELRNAGYDIWMMTGDHPSTARVIAAQLGIDNILAGALPVDKAEKIRELQSSGHKVIMVGDGINDTLALAQADVSVAVGNAADLSLQLSDVVLINNNLSLSRLLVLTDLSKRIFIHVKINLAWAFLYNLIFLPFAAGALYVPTGFAIPPGLAGLSELFSCVPVLLFPLFLYFYEPPLPTDAPDHSSSESEKDENMKLIANLA